jgi:hypothetical protein
MYYNNCAGDEKTHFINILNHNISLVKKAEDPIDAFYYKLLN